VTPAGAVAAPALLALAAVALAGGSRRPAATRRLHGLAGPVTQRWRPAPRRAAGGRRLAAVAAGLGTAVVVSGRPGVVAGAVAFAVVARLLARRPDPSVLGERAAVEHDLPLALDLLACVLLAGQPPSLASAAVATATGGPVGAALGAVAGACALGAPAEEAWEPLGLLAGAPATARAMARAAHSGIALAAELGRTAEDLRAARAAAADVRIRRAGVLVVLPLGLCFLPAFVCVGVVPLVAGVAGSVLR
jgi:Flp pilus assembly protein TadB